MRLCLILRAPDAESGGGAFVGEFVTISLAELDELMSKAGAAPASRGPDPDDANIRAEYAEALKARDAAHSREIDARDRKVVDLERAYKSALRDRELATALVGKPLVPGAATQLIKLWRDDFEVLDDDGAIRIVSKDGRSLDQAVADRLGGPEFAHFCLPSSRGGTGAKGQNRPEAPASSATTADPAGPRNLGERALRQWREAVSKSPSPPSSPGWGRRR